VAADLVAIHEHFDVADLALLDPAASVRHRASEGSGSPDSVRAQISQLTSAWHDLDH
jgi:hypothetical protein